MLSQLSPLLTKLLLVSPLLTLLVIRRHGCATIDWRKLTTGFTYRTISTPDHPLRPDFYDYHNDFMLKFYKRGPYCTYCTCPRCNATTGTDDSWHHDYSREKVEFLTPPARWNKKTVWKDPFNYGYDSDDVKDGKTTMFQFPRFLY